MNCLDNLIGIDKICSPVAPSSGLYINSLPFISLKVADAAINEERISGVKLIEEIITFSQNKILAQIRNHLSSKILLNSVIENDTIGYYRSNLMIVPSEINKLKGVKALIYNYPSLDIFLSKIYLKLSQSITTSIFIIDLMTGEVLDTLPITTMANIPTAILVNKSYPTNGQRTSLFIAIDSSVSSTYETNVGNINGCMTCGIEGYSNKYILFNGGQLDNSLQKIESNVQSNTGTNGLSIEYSLNCSPESFICNMASQLAWPLLHDVGAEIMRRLKYTTRLNSIVTIHGKDNEDLRKEFDDEFMSSLSALLMNLKLPNDVCFQCNSKIKRVVSIP